MWYVHIGGYACIRLRGGARALAGPRSSACRRHAGHGSLYQTLCEFEARVQGLGFPKP